ncbi:hypothetical protein KKF84_02775, partial [Myxococcota bacterium]|nr:hypothetical protein [Myxococcota bacterium]
MKYPVILTFLLSLVFFGCDDSPSSQNTNNLNNTNNANNSNNLNNTNNANNSNNLNNTNNVNNSNNTQNPPLGYLEFVALDIWAMALPENEATLQVSLNGTAIAAEPADLWPSSRYPLTEPGNLTISLEAPYHYTLELSVSFDPAAVPPFHVTHTTAPLKHGISSVAGMDSTTGSELPMVTVFGGLRHKWFSAQGRPARRGNTLELFIDGETYWESLMDDILTASNRILLASWWWESNFELVRDPATHISLTPTQRWENTIMKNLEDSPAVKRILVGEFWGTHDILDWITTDDEILAHAETPADSFEFMGQG